MIGYGTQKKSNVTGAISSLKASDIEDIPTEDQNRFAGSRCRGISNIKFRTASSAATVRVRGITSFGAGSNDHFGL